jgi:hypothetical protein
MYICIYVLAEEQDWESIAPTVCSAAESLKFRDEGEKVGVDGMNGLPQYENCSQLMRKAEWERERERE